MSNKYILVGKEPVIENDPLKWAQSFGGNRHVNKTKLPGGVSVSTVFLGIDHSYGGGEPLLFETMIFGGAQDGYEERYSTWEEAEKGHEIAVKLATEKQL